MIQAASETGGVDMNGKIVLVDGHSILNRAFYAIPEMTDSQGRHTNAVYGFLNILFKVLDEEKPGFLAVAFDRREPTFRHEMYADYKGTRKGMPEELHEQVPLTKGLMEACGIPVLELPGYEADDILGTIAVRSESEGLDVVILSGDRDLLQLATGKIRICIPKTKKGQTVYENYYADDVKETYGVTPKEFIELKALMGDASDNIPGVPGIGEKTGTALIQAYHSVDGVYEKMEEVKPPRARKSLEANKELALLSLKLARICVEAPVDFDIEAASFTNPYTDEAYEFIKTLGMKSFLRRFPDASKKAISNAARNMAKTAADDASQASACSEDRAGGENGTGKGTSTGEANQGGSGMGNGSGMGDPDDGSLANAGLQGTGTAGSTFSPAACPVRAAADLPEVKAKLEGLARELSQESMIAVQSVTVADTYLGTAVCDGREVFYIPDEVLKPADLGSLLETAVENAGHLVALNLKDMLKVLPFKEDPRWSDVSVAAYLINPLKHSYSWDDVAVDFLGEMLPSEKEIVGKTKPAGLSIESIGMLARCAAAVPYAAAPMLVSRLAELGMDKLYHDIEMPLIFSLDRMEKVGIRVDGAALEEYGRSMSERIEELEADIYELAGHSFNINSPKQLGEVLFEEMALPGGKKTKTGYSTAADVLEKLAPFVPVISQILEYRTLTKLKSTYADGLRNYIDQDGRIRGTFNQTVTATGRISSTEPNLQNIPVRTDLGREIRAMFVPKDGCVFVDADYSQIELRILAAMSGDERLIAAYNEARDIHAITASQVFHVPLDEVTPELRRNAKAVNFGIVYGISSFGLSEGLSITRQEAADYIQRYFATYPGVKAFLDGQVAKARKQGHVETLYGRRRPVPEIKSSNYNMRSFGERVAMNSPIQGTAADIMKIAMLRVDRRLREEKLAARIVLQIHDELLLEAPADEAELAGKILEQEMTGAASLAVPLVVEVHSGSNWMEAK
jgi:DNA polymerase-1